MTEPSDAPFARLFDLSLDVVCIAGFDGYLRSFNHAYVRFFGYTEEELLDKPFFELIHPDDHAAVQGIMAELAQGTEVLGFECRSVRADGSVRWLEWNTRAVAEEGLMYTVGRDVTDRHVAADELRALRRIATCVAEAIEPDDLFAIVAEEVARVIGVHLASVVRYESDQTATECACFLVGGPGFAVGTHWSLEASDVLGAVRGSGEAARVNDYTDLKGRRAEAIRHRGIHSTVGVPIVVAGHIWGAVVVGSPDPGVLPDDTEERLGDFTQLLATAIANAESRDALAHLAAEQAALRRAATLAVQGIPPVEIFSAVSNEVEDLFGTAALVLRFDSDGSGLLFAAISKGIEIPEGIEVSIGTRWEVEDSMASSEVYRTGRSARSDNVDWSSRRSGYADAGTRQGVVSSVASPILVEGHLWGVILVYSTKDLLPIDTEPRLEKFTELIAMVIANAESRDALKQLADEQAALRRVATLVAGGAPAAQVFDAVAHEVGDLVGTGTAYVSRFDHDGPALITMGVIGADLDATIGARWELDDSMSTAEVYRTGRSARVDDANWSTVTAQVGSVGRRLRTASAVSSPITLERQLWGVVSVASPERLPDDTGGRLEKFTQLLSTAIANSESQEAIKVLADEQAALRRVATLVAQGVPAAEIFSAVSKEVARLFGENQASVLKFDRDAPVATFVARAAPIPGVEIGTRVELSYETPAGRVYATGRPARVDRTDWSTATSDMGRIARRSGNTSAVCCPIIVDGRPWGSITAMSAAKPLPLDTEGRLERFSHLIATAIANAESRSELAESRRRIVAASDEARRRIERNLHDGTQQRLVSLALAVRATEATVPADLRDIRSELKQTATELGDAVVELQEITRGIHPADLEHSGLIAALRTLARRSPIPALLDITIESRLPEPIEVAAYYIASEALANAVKHAEATRIEISLERRDGSARLSIRDDGRGGADPASGSGLVGLTDRVEALGGSLEVRSPSGHGTSITAMLPLDEST